MEMVLMVQKICVGIVGKRRIMSQLKHTVDIKKELKPLVVANCEHLPFKSNSLDFVMADPPYSKEESEEESIDIKLDELIELETINEPEDEIELLTEDELDVIEDNLRVLDDVDNVSDENPEEENLLDDEWPANKTEKAPNPLLERKENQHSLINREPETNTKIPSAELLTKAYQDGKISKELYLRNIKRYNHERQDNRKKVKPYFDDDEITGFKRNTDIDDDLWSLDEVRTKKECSICGEPLDPNVKRCPVCGGI